MMIISSRSVKAFSVRRLRMVTIGKSTSPLYPTDGNLYRTPQTRCAEGRCYALPRERSGAGTGLLQGVELIEAGPTVHVAGGVDRADALKRRVHAVAVEVAV